MREEDNESFELSFEQIYEYCISPTLLQACDFLFKLLLYNVVFSFITYCFCRSEKTYHIYSTLSGLCYIYLCSFLYVNEAFHVIPLVYCSYILLIVLYKFEISPGVPIGILMVSFLVSYEFAYYSHESWLKIRSIVMIAMMKIMSIAFDAKEQGIPSIWAFSGYIWCPANSVLGPWISYKEYANRLHLKVNKHVQRISSILQYCVAALSFVVFSNCLITYLISDLSDKYLASYRDALSFRMSHYFVSYMASAAMVAGGFKTPISEKKWKYTITKPLEIEFPRSLVMVVINWNIPIHTFLKKNIFSGFLPYGKFFAVLMTYIISSLLHGLNVEVSVVLLSLGLFSYAQFKLQEKFATVLNCCVRARPCRNCSHKNNYYLKTIMNIIFMLISVVYLAYTGCLMENINHSLDARSVISSILRKWGEINYYGHWLALASYSMAQMLR